MNDASSTRGNIIAATQLVSRHVEQEKYSTCSLSILAEKK